MSPGLRVAGRDHIGTALRLPDFVISLANLWHRRELLWTMTSRHLRGQYKQSVLGYAWTLVMPLSQMVTLAFVFATLLKLDSGDPGIPFPLFLFVGLLEIVGEATKILSLSFRLFGNIFAGEVLLATASTKLFAFIVPIPFYFLEFLVGFVQALIFAMLTLVFMVILTQKSGH